MTEKFFINAFVDYFSEEIGEEEAKKRGEKIGSFFEKLVVRLENKGKKLDEFFSLFSDLNREENEDFAL